MTLSAERPSAEGRSETPREAPQRRVPDFFLAGHPKCGTTAMYEILRRHPQIYMPDLKEPRYFASDQRQRFQPRRSGRLPATLEEYLKLFEPALPDQVVGEASPSYLTSSTAAALIAEVQPAARIVAIFREPASFLRSLHLQMVQSHHETVKGFKRAMSLEAARREGRRIPRRSDRPQALLYSDSVRYVDQLRRYEAVFSSEQIMTLIYDDWRSENEATVRKILRFLQVDDAVPVEVEDVNPTVLVRSQHLEEAVNALSVGRGPVTSAAKGAIKAIAPRQLRLEALRLIRRRVVLGKPAPPDEAFMLELRRRFKPEVVALSEHLGRDLVTLWGYDTIA
jgi:hypothetical protein